MKKRNSKEAAHVPPKRRLYDLSFLYNDQCHKSWLSCLFKGVRDQTHPVRRRMAVSHREGLGGCGLLIVQGTMDWKEGFVACFPRTMRKISGDKRWSWVAGLFCRHLMLFLKSGRGKKEGGWRGEKESKKNVSSRGLFFQECVSSKI